MSKHRSAHAATQKNFRIEEPPRAQLITVPAPLKKELKRSLAAGESKIITGDLATAVLWLDPLGVDEAYVIHRDGEIWATVGVACTDNPLHIMALFESLTRIMLGQVLYMVAVVEDDLPSVQGSVRQELPARVEALAGYITLLHDATDKLTATLDAPEPGREGGRRRRIGRTSEVKRRGFAAKGGGLGGGLFSRPPPSK